MGAGNGGGSREAAQEQTTINQKAVAIAAETVVAETAAAVAVAVSMAMATMAAATRQLGSGDSGANVGLTVAEGVANVGKGHLLYSTDTNYDRGGGHLVYYYLHDSTCRCGNH